MVVHFIFTRICVTLYSRQSFARLMGINFNVYFPPTKRLIFIMNIKTLELWCACFFAILSWTPTYTFEYSKLKMDQHHHHKFSSFVSGNLCINIVFFSAKPHSIITKYCSFLQWFGRVAKHSSFPGGGCFKTHWCRVSIILSSKI